MKPPYPTRAPEGFGRRPVLFWFALWTLLAGAAAYFSMLTGFELWDDEGALLISVKHYLEGMKLYLQVYSCYGPVYYLYQWIVHTVTGTPATHDVVRIGSLLPWLGTVLIAAWITLRLTGSLILAGWVHLATSFALAFFASEPGHPQELTLLLLLALAATPVLLRIEDRRSLLMFALGALPAALLLVKVNAGAFAAAAVAMALVTSGPRTRAWVAVSLAGGAACTLLPPMLMRNHLDADWARLFCWLEVASVAACVCCLLRLRRGPALTLRDCVAAAGGFLVTLAVVLAILRVQGVPPAAVYDSVLLAPLRINLLHRAWFRIPDFMKITMPLTFAGLCAAAWAAWRRPLPGARAWDFLCAGKAAFAAIAVFTGLSSRPLLGIVPPFAWLLLFHPNQQEGEPQYLARRLLAILTVMQTLYAYPVAGSQASFIRVLLWVTVMVCVGDSLSWVRASGRVPARFMPWGRTAATGALALLALVQLAAGVRQYRKYQSLPRLDLPGTRLVRANAATKANFHWLVDNLKQQCDVVESYPGLRSLNLWSGIGPSTGLNIDNWAQSFSPAEEQRVVDALATHPRACVVYNQPLTEFWNPGAESMEGHPLVGYIFRNFQPVAASGDYQLLLRKDRIAAPQR